MRSFIWMVVLAAGLTPSAVLAAAVCQSPLTIDFEVDGSGNALSTGQVIDGEFTLSGITVSANNTGGGPDIAIVFDSANPSGGDPDLGTPNSAHGGPGIGAGGAGNNISPLGKILIIAEDDVDVDMNNLIDDPDDEAGGGTIVFDFDQPVNVESVEVLDVEETGSTVETRDAGGSLIASESMVSVGDNSYQVVTLEDEGVSKLVIGFAASGGLASVVYCAQTPTPTPTGTATNTPADTATATATNTPADTATATFTATNTPEDTATATATNTAADTATATFTATNTPENTATATATPTNTAADTATATATNTPADTATATATDTAADTATATVTDTPANTATATDTPADTATATATATASETGTATATPTATATIDSCGDGTLDAGEVCDDGNEINGDGCEDDCTISAACTFTHGGTPFEVYVNDGTGNDGVGTPAGCASGTFASIQSAIDDGSVGDGDIVSICPGTYAESVIVSKEVTVRSTDGAAATSVTSPGTAFDVQRSGVSILDLTIEATGVAIAANSICPLGQSSCGAAGGSNVTISGNTIENSGSGVAWQSRVDCALIDSNTMTGNGAHIDIEQTTGTPAVLFEAMSNTITGGGSSGQAVRLSGLGVLAVFAGNVVDGSAGDGVVVASLATDARVEENDIRNNPGSGILVLAGAAGTRVRQNNIEDNGTGLTNQAPEGVLDATLNWWGSQSGPFHVTDLPGGIGNPVVESGGGLDTDFIEFLCAPAPGGFPSVNALCGGGEGEEINFVAFGRQPDVSPNGRFIVFVSDKDINGDEVVTIDNSDGSDEVFLLNRKPGGRDVSFCLGGTTPGAVCQSQRDCPADFQADPIVNEGACVLLTQLSNDASGSGASSAPRVTRNGNVFFATNSDLLGTNGDGSSEVHVWSRRDNRKQSPPDPNLILTMLSNGTAGLDSDVPGSDRGGRRRVFMQSAADPIGTNADGNVEIMVLDVKKDVWTQITDTTGPDNLRPSTQTGRQVLFDSQADLTGGNADGNREIFFAKFKRGSWVITQITDTLVVENRAGTLSKRGKILVFSSDGDYVGQNADGNREIFLWAKGVFEQVTDTTVGENTNPQSNPRGRFVVFESTSDVEDDGDTPTNRRVHLFDRKTGVTLPISRSFFGENTLPHISQGRFVVWESTANLTGQNPGAEKVIYLFDRRKDD